VAKEAVYLSYELKSNLSFLHPPAPLAREKIITLKIKRMSFPPDQATLREQGAGRVDAVAKGGLNLGTPKGHFLANLPPR
jgi:hypothetical protein